jgi:hypothetical protein
MISAGIIISYIITGLISIVCFFLARNMNRVDEENEKQSQEIQQIKLEFAEYKSKLWTQQQLKEMIEDAVTKGLLAFENKLLKNNKRGTKC